MASDSAPPTDEMSLRMARLSERQRQCLALVARHFSSKEIAAELGLSSHTVDNQLKVAARVLGATSRAQAARMFASNGLPGIGDQSPELADASRPPPDRGTAERSGSSSITVHLPPPPYRRGERNDLTRPQRLAWMVAITVTVLLAIYLSLTIPETISRHIGANQVPDQSTLKTR